MTADATGREIDALLREAGKLDKDADFIRRTGDNWAAGRLADEAARLRQRADDAAARYAERSR